MNVLEIALYDREETRIRVREGFARAELSRFDGLWKWLWNKAVKHRLITPFFGSQTVVSRRLIIDRSNLPEVVMDAVEAVYNHHCTPSEILMGPKTYRSLMSQPLVRDTDMFSYSLNDRKLCGIKVSVLPWMEGLLVR